MALTRKHIRAVEVATAEAKQNGHSLGDWRWGGHRAFNNCLVCNADIAAFAFPTAHNNKWCEGKCVQEKCHDG